jgi:hypothetical protein
MNKEATRRGTPRPHNGGARPNAGRKGSDGPIKMIRLDEETSLELAQVTAYLKSVRGSDLSQGKVLAEIVHARYLELEGIMEMEDAS